MRQAHAKLLEAREALPETGALLKAAAEASTEPCITAAAQRLLAQLGELLDGIESLADGIEEDGMLVSPSAYRFRCNKCSHTFSDPEPKCAAGPHCPRCAHRPQAVQRERHSDVTQLDTTGESR